MKLKPGIPAKIALFSATIIWGSSFFIMKTTVDVLPPFLLLAVRFTLSALLLALIFIKRVRTCNLGTLWRGSVLGVLIFLGYAFQTFGLMQTTPGKNAFLTTVYCVMVPFLYWIFAKTKPDVYNISASFICIAGIALVSFNEQITMGMGDFLTLVCGLFYALHIVSVAKFSKGRDIIVLTVIQFGAAGLLSWIFGLIFETVPAAITTQSLVSVLYLAIFPTGLALLLQNVGQKYTHPSTAAVILSLESVFGVLFSIVFYHETLTLKIAFGFALIFISVIISETKLEFLRKRKQNDIVEPVPVTEDLPGNT